MKEPKASVRVKARANTYEGNDRIRVQLSTAKDRLSHLRDLWRQGLNTHSIPCNELLVCHVFIPCGNPCLAGSTGVAKTGRVCRQWTRPSLILRDGASLMFASLSLVEQHHVGANFRDGAREDALAF